jgi:hypothetical protein
MFWDAELDIVHCAYNINPLTPNDTYRGRTAPLTSKRCILYIYSTNIGTEYLFGSCIIHILNTVKEKKKKKKIPAPKV